MGNSQPSGTVPSSETFFEETDPQQGSQGPTHGTHISKNVLEHIQARKKNKSQRKSSNEPIQDSVDSPTQDFFETPVIVEIDLDDDEEFTTEDSYVLKQVRVNEKTNKIMSEIMNDHETELIDRINKLAEQFDRSSNKDEYLDTDFFKVTSNKCLEEEEDLEDCLKEFGPRKCQKYLKDYNLCSLKANFNKFKSY